MLSKKRKYEEMKKNKKHTYVLTFWKCITTQWQHLLNVIMDYISSVILSLLRSKTNNMLRIAVWMNYFSYNNYVCFSFYQVKTETDFKYFYFSISYHLHAYKMSERSGLGQSLIPLVVSLNAVCLIIPQTNGAFQMRN